MSFYFAWVANGGTAFGAEHHVVDEDIFAWEIEHLEGDFAALRIDTQNPQVGLLNEDRDQWCWFAWNNGVTVVPLFHGRLVGVPESIDKRVVTLEFVARPEDFEAQKAALAETLKVAPFWDPIWIDEDEQDNPDVVLEARAQLWHIGRTDKTVTVSHILIPEDGQFTFDGTKVIADTLDISYGQEPIRHVHVEATVAWDQFRKGTVDLTDKIVEAFDEAGSSPPNISSYTGQGLESTWPLFGTAIGGGWTVGTSSVRLLSTLENSAFVETPLDPSQAVPGEGDIVIEDWWADSPEGFDFWYEAAVAEWLAEQMANPTTKARFYRWDFKPVFMADYEATRSRTEILSFDVFADIQPLVADAEDQVVEITLNSSRIVEPIDPGEEIPIGDIARNAYFSLERAEQSIEYLLAMARSRILIAARAVEISFEVPFAEGVAFSCRKGVVLTLPDLPGGECEGKIIGYKLWLDDGQLFASCTIGCSIGKGNSLPAPSAGNPDYVQIGYVEAGYQYMAGATFNSIPGELHYDSFDIPVTDDGLDLTDMTPDNVIIATPASALLTFSGVGVLNNTITIQGHVYTLVPAPSAPDMVKIGGTADETARNFADAVNATEDQAGFTYGVGTVAHADVYATVQDAIVRVTARIAGPAGNALTVSETSPHASWGSATLTNGDDGLVVIDGVNVQHDLLEETYPDVEAAIEALNARYTRVQLALKPVTGGPFETLYPITVSDLMVPKTIDLESA